MNVPTPKYFVLTSDGELHGYNREDILKCDIAANSHTPPERLFKLSPNATGTILHTNYAR